MTRIRFFGAAGEVTGSCALLETDTTRILVDFGMFQGNHEDDTRNRKLPPIEPERLDAVVLTHAHLDHCGRLPLLPLEGFRGPVVCTPATRDVARIILMDSAGIQEEDARRAAEGRGNRGRGANPLYVTADAEAVLQMFRTQDYGEEREIAPGIRLRFHDAGHILGAAIAELRIRDGDRERRVVFSGDIGPDEQPLLPPPTPLKQANLVVLESTYGDRDHRSYEATIEELRGILRDAVENRGRILIPSFAIGRTQLLLFVLREFRQEPWFREVPVFLDSPMAIAATQTYREYADLFDDDTWTELRPGEAPMHFQGLQLTPTPQESRRISELDGPLVVIAGSGMCTGGRILHHFRNHLGKASTHVVIVGYQGRGTLGRKLVDGAREVRIFGQAIEVGAQIHTLGGFSAHAGQSELVAWAGHFGPDWPHFLLVHGEEPAREELARALHRAHGVTSHAPKPGELITVE